MGEGFRWIKNIIYDLHKNMRIKAPIIIKIVWTKSVHMTAVRPPAMVKRAAIASRIRMEVYSPAFTHIHNMKKSTKIP